ncbi:MAG TPA: hypothetical protein VEJ23_06085, partial [Solirubrobacteraceae bacterium]|nr:hypothetical protein [Solirubrobacteraceae bacterium]
DLLAAQRVMTQKTFERVRRIELELGVAPSHYEPGARAGAGLADDALDAALTSQRPPAPRPPSRAGARSEEHEAARL